MEPDVEQFRRQQLIIDGLAFNVIVEGSGPDVLLVHGFPDDHTVWRRQIPVLVAAGYRVIAPDTRGCGDSALDPALEHYRIERLVADLIGVLDALGVAKVRLVGHDWGAVQAWQLALRHPERIDRLIVLSVGHPAAYARGGLAQKLRGYYIWLMQLRGLMEFLAVRLDWYLFRQMAAFPAEFPRWRERLGRPGRLTAGFNYYRANLRLFWSRNDARLTVPAVGVWSDGDRFLVERQMRDSERYCEAGWHYERIEGCNHWLQLTAPEAFNRLLLKHLHPPQDPNDNHA
ncbi:MAG TPA: alpha/beta fold hydrolase [Steroidobacteraceae bacterium]|nr:alpha/beta fold hydrolase [Steroidobacteraceae bacterium]